MFTMALRGGVGELLCGYLCIIEAGDWLNINSKNDTAGHSLFEH